ncbi:hypothetical protein BCR43DRAFT_481792 [Syncephalastrum racemosum]|uniref:Uncharacterized protein n=1 Tax=Syncephalastrum racemosum TaxID=13706 RepID=A0A1X2HSR4_SYNRA|nr:hypothetical protein BCR43DRAFT_481792 [Syncephalastrum racemosum]
MMQDRWGCTDPSLSPDMYELLLPLSLTLDLDDTCFIFFFLLTCLGLPCSVMGKRVCVTLQKKKDRLWQSALLVMTTVRHVTRFTRQTKEGPSLQLFSLFPSITHSRSLSLICA